MQPRVLQRFALTAVLVLGAGVSVVSTSAARPTRPGPQVRSAKSSVFSLFGGVAQLRLNANRVDCNVINNKGNQCDNPYGSGTVEGGFWPNGTGDNYVFNGGLQVAGTVFSDPAAGQTPFSWDGDTVGVFFMDPTGFYQEGDAITNIYSSLNSNDVASWPAAAYVKDPSLYNAALLGRLSISQQDTWVRYWDGNTSITSGRKHAMGLLVEQRGLLWNFPAGNQDILYFLFRFINITSTNAADYAGLSAAGYTGTDIAAIVQIAQNFHDAVSAQYNITLPTTGYTFHNVFANYFQDADEGNQSSLNYSQAVLPFSLVAVMKDNYKEALWGYPAGVFGEPFYPAPGFEAVKYLKSPVNPLTGREFGISVWGNTCNASYAGCTFQDADGVPQMYRYISGQVSPSQGDGICNSDPVLLHTCNSIQGPADTRFFQASGPFELAPGQSSVIVVALVFAAPLHKWAATTNGIYSMPAGSLDGSQGTNYVAATDAAAPLFVPGWPAQPDTLAIAGTRSGAAVCTTLCGKTATIRDPVERPMGWGQFSDVNGDQIIEQNEVQTAPGSLLDKAKVAQAIFDAKFLLPFAPDAPTFYLVPGDNSVTIAWTKSNTENVFTGGGDPYYAVASSDTSALYDPDYRQYDVEGYRIWRGRTAAEMQLVAQFDYSGTVLTDYTGQVFDANNPNCAPEIGLGSTGDTLLSPQDPTAKYANNCAVKFQYPYTGTGPSVDYPLAGTIVQIPPGGRTQLANGNVLVLQADTAVVGGASGLPALIDNGVPFAYIDNQVSNGFQYFYAVSAFDVNSVKSGPSSLQSSLVPKSVTPRPTGTNALAPVIISGIYGDDTTRLDPTKSSLAIDPATGAFSGIVPPTNATSFSFLASVAGALAPGDITAHIDSVTPGSVGGFGGPYGKMYVTFSSGPDTSRAAFGFDNGKGYNQLDVTDPTNWVPFSASAPLVEYDSTRSAALGILPLRSLGARMPVQFSGFIAPMGAISDGNYTMSSRRYPWSGQTPAENHSAYLNHAVWYDEGGSEPPQPTLSPFASPDHSNGKLTGVSMIYEPLTYRLPNTGTPPGINLLARYVQYGTSLGHPGDFVVTWNADSTISVRDSTDHVNLPFSPEMRASWGFLNERALVASGVADGDIADGTGSPTVGVVGYWHRYTIVPVCSITFGTTCSVLQNKAEFEPINYDNTGAANGNGIELYIDGMYFIMQMSALPAAGTKWHLKAVAGVVDATCSTYAPATPAAVPASCSGYTYAALPYSSPYVPGLNVKMRVTQAFTIAKAAGNLNNIHTVPDPYYVTNSLETSANTKVLEFVNLPNQCIIRIYSVSGILVRVLTHNDPTGGGLAVWDLRNRNNQFVASGVYFYHVEAPDGSTKIGRFTVVNFAQ